MSAPISSFQSLLEVLESLRPGYVTSLGTGVSCEEVCKTLGIGPASPFVDVYTKIHGTSWDAEQKYFDFIPGYRILTLPEIPAITLGDPFLEEFRQIPFLTNYSSDYGCMGELPDEPCTIHLQHYPPVTEYANFQSFLQTVAECYKSGAYFLGDDGVLDIHFDLQKETAIRLNPGVPYWLGEE